MLLKLDVAYQNDIYVEADSCSTDIWVVDGQMLAKVRLDKEQIKQVIKALKKGLSIYDRPEPIADPAPLPQRLSDIFPFGIDR